MKNQREKLLRLLGSAGKKAEQAEVFEVSTEMVPVHFEANRLKQIQSGESTAIALRIFREGKVGFAVGQGAGDVETLVAMAVQTAPFGPRANFEFPSARDYPPIDVFDAGVPRLSMKRMVELGSELIARVREHAPDLLCDAGVIRGTSSVHLVNSRGGEADWEESFFSVTLEGMLVQGTDMLLVGDSESSCRFSSDISPLAGRVITQLERAKSTAAISPGQMPVIFTPLGVASALLAPLVLAFSGRAVLDGASPLQDRLGEEVFDPKLTLWDDATLPYRPGSCPCDGEGVPSRRIPLVSQGVVANFLYDLPTAALAGKKSTGSGRRMGDRLPAPGISSLVIEEGRGQFEDMVGDIKEGLVVEQLMGGTQGNLLNGDFSGNVLLGYKVERGNISGRVKDTMISGNVYQVLREIIAIGSEARWVDGIFRLPHLYCPRLSVAAKA